MIQIGCTSFKEHTYLTGKKENSLFEYAAHFPLVEMDTSFYAIPKKTYVEEWLKQVPEDFRFIMKIPKELTQHAALPEEATYKDLAEELLAALSPMQKSGHLYCLLAQFPPFFECKRENVDYLIFLRKLFPQLPLAVEFRHPSWYSAKWQKETRAFMEKLQFSLVMVDEPKKLSSTVPLDPFITNPNFVFFRFHGRNDAGWVATGPDAKRVRTLYRYSEAELEELKQVVSQVAQKSSSVAVIFNNNAGGDAAENALQFKELLHLDFGKLNPSQLDLF